MVIWSINLSFHLSSNFSCNSNSNLAWWSRSGKDAFEVWRSCHFVYKNRLGLHGHLVTFPYLPRGVMLTLLFVGACFFLLNIVLISCYVRRRRERKANSLAGSIVAGGGGSSGGIPGTVSGVWFLTTLFSYFQRASAKSEIRSWNPKRIQRS